ncbi:hypothetical protein QJ48_01425 [Paenibacillus sp. A3]|uniref:hypothetical protein n=1 Tax=Paenibacillus sp. A3 TaxID=1337054 RepID=UPI0006D5B4B7|nr:hypothetical protein [Paenibacillus sp. A3]KPV61162.1 hypothetical protein QJ48_01425 [Paenibacillus sp. A3]
MKTIKSVTKNGLSYTDENGIEKFVDFNECHENWIRYRIRSENLNDAKIEDVKINDRCIGQRDSCARPQFIEFFTRPFTRFEFEESIECPYPDQAFMKLKNDIISAGWTTLDLS